MRLGIDLVRLDELDRLLRRAWFVRYVFAADELAHAETLGDSRRREYLAGRFAAKEAVLKVLGTGLFEGVAPRDIALLRDSGGRPTVVLRGSAAHAARSVSITHVSVSVTHKRDLVAVVAAGW
ncbi:MULTISPECIES: holo-ACP synthase [unclassified Micromonospora]|uniref:holo-ACP synthase n=1 Tax=unclassified Micromonospora TaxID=2617518 RepID=UPI00104AFC81|nr:MULTISPECIES: holo-ACP synthase [unclassified Micromonospora]TDB82787.1 holo-[acyl-carrier-protein] synthase [Micromonospora sp. KC721]TDC41583.1 holo-[acyl-carrier-protein] synthase [Micromonospora sp. KC213]